MFLITLKPEIVSGRAQQKQTQAEKHKDFFVFVTGNDHHVIQFGRWHMIPTNLPCAIIKQERALVRLSTR